MTSLIIFLSLDNLLTITPCKCKPPALSMLQLSLRSNYHLRFITTSIANIKRELFNSSSLLIQSFTISI
nr:MAG TPA: hypothetical protein [Caudoviricetes sp.]